jgi:nitrate reductase alpha subunit
MRAGDKLSPAPKRGSLYFKPWPETVALTSLGPLADTLGNGGKGISWNTQDEVRGLGELNYRVNDGGPTDGRPRIESDIDAAEVTDCPNQSRPYSS